MIVIHVQCKIQPDKRDEFVGYALQELKHNTDPGCVRYSWSQALNEPNTFTLYQEWSSEEAFDAFRTSDEFKQVGGKMFALMAEAPVSNYYSALEYSAPVPAAN